MELLTQAGVGLGFAITPHWARSQHPLAPRVQRKMWDTLS